MVMELPLDHLIDILESSIPKRVLPDPEEEEYKLYLDQDDPLNFVGTLTQEELDYISLMKGRQRQQPLHALQPRPREDFVCEVCRSGDYEDENLIVICSLCNIGMHQLCIFLPRVPEHNWICEVCEAFGPPGINLPCPLCSITGGAMKRSSTSIA
jgi:hypothetical protein